MGMKQIVIGSLLVLALAGCSKSGPDGEKVTVNPTTGDMTIKDKDGKVTEFDNKGDSWTAKSSDGTEMKFEDGKMTGKNEKGETFESGAMAVSEGDLGLPFYPGSKELEFGSAKMQTGEQVTFSVNRSTSDMPDKVIEFYKAKFVDPQTFSTDASGANQAQVSGNLKDGSEAAVIVHREKGKADTMIMITVGRKKSK